MARFGGLRRERADRPASAKSESQTYSLALTKAFLTCAPCYAVAPREQVHAMSEAPPNGLTWYNLTQAELLLTGNTDGRRNHRAHHQNSRRLRRQGVYRRASHPRDGHRHLARAHGDDTG